MKQQDFVEFFSPGTFVAENNILEIDSWDTEIAMKMADEITQRHGATPFGFRFLTKSRNENELDSKVTKTSGMYYLGGKIMTREEVPDTKENRILRSNMEINYIKRVIQNDNSWSWVEEFSDEDTLLDYIPPSKRKETS